MLLLPFSILFQGPAPPKPSPAEGPGALPNGQSQRLCSSLLPAQLPECLALQPQGLSESLSASRTPLRLNPYTASNIHPDPQPGSSQALPSLFPCKSLTCLPALLTGIWGCQPSTKPPPAWGNFLVCPTPSPLSCLVSGFCCISFQGPREETWESLVCLQGPSSSEVLPPIRPSGHFSPSHKSPLPSSSSAFLILWTCLVFSQGHHTALRLPSGCPHDQHCAVHDQHTRAWQSCPAQRLAFLHSFLCLGCLQQPLH